MTELGFTFLSSMETLSNFSVREVFAACLIIFAIAVMLYWKTSKKKYKLPPGPIGFPFLGKEPFRELNRLKEIYGSVFSLYMGWTYTVILGEFEAVKEAYAKTTEKSAVMFDLLPDSLGFSGQNGEEWFEQRKFCVKSMRELGIGKERWESMIQVEVDDLVKMVSSFNGQPIDISKKLTSSVSNNISSFVFGKRLPLDHPDRIFLDSVVDEIIQLLGKTPSSHLLSAIQVISIKLGVGKLYKRLKKFNDFFRKETEKLKESYKSGEHESFTVDYLKEMDRQKDKSGHFFNEINLYGNIQGLYLGGSETTRTAIYWLLLIMASFPEIQTKVHQELDSVLGENGQIRWSERKKVPFTFATVMEGQRWRTLTTLNSPRIATKDVKVQNYDIPKGTRIVVNIWSLHHDPKYWKKPERFDPERFLTRDGKEVITRKTKLSWRSNSFNGDIIVLYIFNAKVYSFTTKRH